MTNRFNIAADTWDTPERVERASELAKIIIDNIEKKENINAFELGTGTGIMAVLLSEAFDKIIAADSSEGMLRVLKEKIEKYDIKNIDPFYFDIERSGVSENEFDIVYSAMVLHHIYNLEEAIGKIYQMLKKGGKIFIFDLSKEDGDFHHDNSGVAHFGFADDNLRKIFSEAGFTNISITEATSILKMSAAGEKKRYPIFSLIAEK